jgi:hypothetical protein
MYFARRILGNVKLALLRKQKDEVMDELEKRSYEFSERFARSAQRRRPKRY